MPTNYDASKCLALLAALILFEANANYQAADGVESGIAVRAQRSKRFTVRNAKRKMKIHAARKRSALY